MAYFCIDASALKWPPFALPAESMASQYSVTSDSASGFAVRWFLFSFSPLNGKERWRHLPTLFFSTHTLTDSVFCLLIDITLSALRKDINISTKSEFNCMVYAYGGQLITLAEVEQFNCLFLCKHFRYQGPNVSWYHKTHFFSANNVG